ncbi:hypothetical protein [Desulfopila aestuarii]|uniref:hypothetical protein n=1 Tax=Desulfopila aestuarii TaxID=231440 RepID=UPI00135671D6|nr:hypothetical protein [Desulfopila aestuarii]
MNRLDRYLEAKNNCSSPGPYCGEEASRKMEPAGVTRMKTPGGALQVCRQEGVS